MVLFFYLFIKLFSYALVCGLSGMLFKLQGTEYLEFAFGWGFVRLLVGFVFGILILFIVSSLHNTGIPPTLGYLLSFGVPRYLEWSIVYLAITKRHSVKFDWRIHGVVCCGVVVSFLTDLVAQNTGLTHLNFHC